MDEDEDGVLPAVPALLRASLLPEPTGPTGRRPTLSETLSGWLLKQSRRNPKAWKARWLLLKRRDSLLLLFHEENEDKPRRVIDLRRCGPIEAKIVVPALTDGSSHDSQATQPPAKLTREIHIHAPQRTFAFRVEREDDFQTWTEYLESAQSTARTAKQGYLLKQGGTIKTWKQRWFVLKDRQLLYYKCKEDASDTAIQGHIDLTDALSIGVADERIGRPNSLAIELKHRTYFFTATTAEERDDWLTVLMFHPQYPSGGNV